MIAIWILMSVIIGAIAANNGRSFLGWTVIAMLVSPVIGAYSRIDRWKGVTVARDMSAGA